MADQKISARTAAGTLDGTELVGVVKDGADRRTTALDIAALAAGKGYKEYAAILSQTGTSAPTVPTLLVNDFSGPIVWTRNGVGDYRGTLVGAFTIGKTLVTPMNFYNKLTGKGFYAYPLDADTINILARDDSGAFADLNISQATDFTIKVYP